MGRCGEIAHLEAAAVDGEEGTAVNTPTCWGDGLDELRLYVVGIAEGGGGRNGDEVTVVESHLEGYLVGGGEG